MKSDNIQEKETLAHYVQVQGMVYQLLTVARGAGLHKERAEAVYDEIMTKLSNMPGSTFWLFRQELITVLTAADPTSDFESESEDEDWEDED